MDLKKNNPLLDQLEGDKRQTYAEIVKQYPKVKKLREFIFKKALKAKQAELSKTEDVSPIRSIFLTLADGIAGNYSKKEEMVPAMK